MSMLSDLLSGLAMGGTGTPNSATAAVPQTPVSPTYIPQDAVTQQYNLANQLRRVAPATSWAGVAAQGLGAIGGNLVQGDANNALAADQAQRSAGIQAAANAPDITGLSKALISSNVPALQDTGLQTKVNYLANNTPVELATKQAQLDALNRENALRGKSFGPVGTDMYGNPQYGERDLNKPNAVAPAAAVGPQATDATQPTGQHLTGDAYLATLPPPIANLIKGVAEGKQVISPRAKNFAQLTTMVNQYDPTFDAINYNARAKMRLDATSGKMATSNNAMNTVIGHLQALSDAADKLGNGNYPLLNTAENAYKSASGGTSVTNFNTVKSAVIDEVVKVWRANGGNESDIREWSKNIDSSNSPQQLHQAIGHIAELLESKLKANQDQYDQGMGTKSAPIRMITPQARASLDVMQARANGDKPKIQGKLSAATGDVSTTDPLAQARDAISKGAPRDAVIKRLQQNGIDPSGL